MMEIVKNWCAKNAVVLSDAQMDALAALKACVLDGNSRMNLTTIVEDTAFAVKHIVDSLTLVPHIPENAELLDIGSGAGFPGLVVAIARPDVRVTLLDSLHKRVDFLQETVEKLGLENVDCVQGRAGEGGVLVDKLFDVCTARAVAKLTTLVGYALPFLKRGGVFLAMKGCDIAQEMLDAEKILQKKRGRWRDTVTVEIADELRHVIVVAEKM
jgi:16S rRNA (guanine527-N7)-methyltransferase